MRILFSEYVDKVIVNLHLLVCETILAFQDQFSISKFFVFAAMA